MTYTDIYTFLTELTFIQTIGMLFVMICLFCITWTILTYITIGFASSVKDQNKELLDNMHRLDTKLNNNQKLTK